MGKDRFVTIACAVGGCDRSVGQHCVDGGEGGSFGIVVWMLIRGLGISIFTGMTSWDDDHLGGDGR